MQAPKWQTVKAKENQGSSRLIYIFLYACMMFLVCFYSFLELYTSDDWLKGHETAVKTGVVSVPSPTYNALSGSCTLKR